MGRTTSQTEIMVAVRRLGAATMPQVQVELLEGLKLRRSDGQVYTTLERLRIPGLMDSEIRQNRNTLGRLRAMRFYWLTALGHKALDQALDEEIARAQTLARVAVLHSSG